MKKTYSIVKLFVFSILLTACASGPEATANKLIDALWEGNTESAEKLIVEDPWWCDSWVSQTDCLRGFSEKIRFCSEKPIASLYRTVTESVQDFTIFKGTKSVGSMELTKIGSDWYVSYFALPGCN